MLGYILEYQIFYYQFSIEIQIENHGIFSKNEISEFLHLNIRNDNFYILLTLDINSNHSICFHLFYSSFLFLFFLVSCWGGWKRDFSSFWKIFSNWKRKGNSQGDYNFIISFHFYLSFILLINVFLSTLHLVSVS